MKHIHFVALITLVFLTGLGPARGGTGGLNRVVEQSVDGHAIARRVGYCHSFGAVLRS